MAVQTHLCIYVYCISSIRNVLYVLCMHTHKFKQQYECSESNFEWSETIQRTKQIEHSCSGKLHNNSGDHQATTTTITPATTISDASPYYYLIQFLSNKHSHFKHNGIISIRKMISLQHAYMAYTIQKCLKII